jgi:RNase adaptor protein for sRNA GlmZ degradation
MKISILSFSYKRGLPEDETGNGGGFVFDCRAMPNPFWDESLRGFAGCDTPVVEFFEQHKDRVDCFLDAAEVLVRQSIEQYQKDGREHLQVAFGCTGNAPAAKRSGCLSATREPRRGRKGPSAPHRIDFT